MHRMLSHVGLIAFTLAVTSNTLAFEGSPRVFIPRLGAIVGSTNISAWNKNIIYQFQGIPYALPPSGHRRFKVR